MMSPLDRKDTPEIARRLKLGDGIGFLARVLSARANLAFHQLTEQTDYTPRQFGALLTLHQRGSMTLTELAAAIEVDRSTLSEMARRMSERGLLSRSGNHRDRRSAKVAITREGTEVLLGLVDGAARLQGRLLAALPADQHAPFLRMLKAVAAGDGLARAPAGAGVDPDRRGTA